MIKNNYRPVSILSVFTKVFDTIVTNQLIEYFKCILIICYMHTEKEWM